jgi:hypothetical protein
MKHNIHDVGNDTDSDDDNPHGVHAGKTIKNI